MCSLEASGDVCGLLPVGDHEVVGGLDHEVIPHPRRQGVVLDDLDACHDRLEPDDGHGLHGVLEEGGDTAPTLRPLLLALAGEVHDERTRTGEDEVRPVVAALLELDLLVAVEPRRVVREVLLGDPLQQLPGDGSHEAAKERLELGVVLLVLRAVVEHARGLHGAVGPEDFDEVGPGALGRPGAVAGFRSGGGHAVDGVPDMLAVAVHGGDPGDEGEHLLRGGDPENLPLGEDLVFDLLELAPVVVVRLDAIREGVLAAAVLEVGPHLDRVEPVPRDVAEAVGLGRAQGAPVGRVLGAVARADDAHAGGQPLVPEHALLQGPEERGPDDARSRPHLVQQDEPAALLDHRVDVLVAREGQDGVARRRDHRHGDDAEVAVALLPRREVQEAEAVLARPARGLGGLGPAGEAGQEDGRAPARARHGREEGDEGETVHVHDDCSRDVSVEMTSDVLMEMCGRESLYPFDAG